MSRISLALLASTALFAGAASAADLPMKSAPYVAPAPATSWTGFYIGGNVGGASTTVHYKDYGDTFDNQGLNPDRKIGFIGGVHGGINFQHNSFVYGVEAAWSWVDASDTTFPIGTAGNSVNSWISYKAKDYGSVKGRAGLAFGDTLLYVAAGPAWGNFDLSASCCSAGNTASARTTKLGLVGAVGVEHMLTPNWILRGQVELAEFNTQREVIIPGGSAANPREVGQDTSILSATVGLSYKFGWK